jgi:Zn-dependent protease with chaperone function
MPLKGLFYDGQSAKRHTLLLELDTQGILHATPPLTQPIAFEEITLSQRIGNIARTLTFPSGAVFETNDHQTLDVWLNKHQINHGWLPHKLESSASYAIGALLFMLLFIAWSYNYGIPRFSKLAANALPVEASRYIGHGTMEILDERFFLKTELGVQRQHSLTKQFNQLLPNAENDEGMKYKLLFRKGGHIGANAFALPDGTVVITDELIKIATHDEEILSILMHETGHVIHCHSLRRVISHSGLAVLTVLITGDVSSADELVLALPNILMDSSYSRDHEWEADTYALKTMQKRGIPTSRFADIMERLESYQAEFETKPDGNDKSADNNEYKNADDMDYDWLDYMSSHPANKDRIARFRDAKTITSRVTGNR